MRLYWPNTNPPSILPLENPDLEAAGGEAGGVGLQRCRESRSGVAIQQVADVVGSSRLAWADEGGTLQRGGDALSASTQLLNALVSYVVADGSRLRRFPRVGRSPIFPTRSLAERKRMSCDALSHELVHRLLEVDEPSQFIVRISLKGRGQSGP